MKLQWENTLLKLSDPIKKAILIFGDLLIVTFAIVAAYSIRLEKFYFIQDILSPANP